MKNFKSGQKVVFRLGRDRDIIERENVEYVRNFIIHAENSVLTINHSHRPGWWIVDEFMWSQDGIKQAFCELVLFPLEEIAKEQTEKITADIERTFQPAKELIA